MKPTRFADRLKEFLPDLAYRILDGVGRFIPLEAPDKSRAHCIGLHERLRTI